MANNRQLEKFKFDDKDVAHALLENDFNEEAHPQI